MKVTIETYRGIEIWFDNERESFQCDIDDERSVKKSYASIKKFIDDWKKENQDFKRIKVQKNPSSMYSGSEGFIVGIRKDNRFIFSDESDKKRQISEYEENDFILFVQENQIHLKDLSDLEAERIGIAKDFDLRIKKIKSQIKVITLKDFKKDLI